MTLHRDIYWLGRQWAVTGHGIQAVDKKLNMRFDIEVSRIGEDGLDQPMQGKAWFDAEDFAEAVRVARRLSQETPAKFQPLAGGEK
jgi:polyisoprenoid-binding protein YceI